MLLGLSVSKNDKPKTKRKIKKKKETPDQRALRLKAAIRNPNNKVDK